MQILTQFKVVYTVIIMFYSITTVTSETRCLGEADPTGVDYEGTLSTTESGRSCQRWDLPNPRARKFRPHHAWDHRNYCRNPQGSRNRPWCYTAAWKGAWEYCDVGDCHDSKQIRMDETQNDDDTLHTPVVSHLIRFHRDRRVMPTTNSLSCGVQAVAPKFSNQHFKFVGSKLVRRTRVKRVIGGDHAVHGSWPWMVAIIKYGKLDCGGALIRPDWVLTAAHCTDFVVITFSFVIKAGHQFGSEIEAQTRAIERILIHPDYQPVEVVHDISLIQLKRPFEITDHVRLVCLPAMDYILPADTYCVSAGWGYTKDDRHRRPLEQVVLPVLSYGQCQINLGKSMNDKTQMCAGWRSLGHDTCEGDSGGPLMCVDTSSKLAKWTVQGVTSWTYSSCEQKGGIGSYTRISKYVEWIEGITDSQAENPL